MGYDGLSPSRRRIRGRQSLGVVRSIARPTGRLQEGFDGPVDACDLSILGQGPDRPGIAYAGFVPGSGRAQPSIPSISSPP